MAQFFATFSEFKTRVGGSVNQSFELGSIAPYIEMAAERHIVPYLGRAFYDALLADYVADTLTADEEALVLKLQRPLALLAVYEYFPSMTVQVSEAGVYRVETESHKTAFRYQEAALRQSFLESGYEALETLLNHLSLNRNTFAAWRDGAEGNAYLTTLLNTVGDFRVYYGNNLSRHTFECLRAAIRRTENEAIKAAVPAAFWAVMLTAYKANTLTDSQKALLALWREAIAHFATEIAMRTGAVEMKGGRLVETFVGVEQGTVSEKQPAMLDAAVKQWLHSVAGNQRTYWWRQYMADNKAQFPAAFDTASGGTNTAADAWHIQTADELATAESLRVETAKGAGIVVF